MNQPLPEHPVSQLLDVVANGNGRLPTTTMLRKAAHAELGDDDPAAVNTLTEQLRTVSRRAAARAAIGHAGEARTIARDAARQLARPDWERRPNDDTRSVREIIADLPRY